MQHVQPYMECEITCGWWLSVHESVQEYRRFCFSPEDTQRTGTCQQKHRGSRTQMWRRDAWFQLLRLLARERTNLQQSLDCNHLHCVSFSGLPEKVEHFQIKNNGKCPRLWMEFVTQSCMAAMTICSCFPQSEDCRVNDSSFLHSTQQNHNCSQKKTHLFFKTFVICGTGEDGFHLRQYLSLAKIFHALIKTIVMLRIKTSSELNMKIMPRCQCNKMALKSVPWIIKDSELWLVKCSSAPRKPPFIWLI